jgi:hypothetical protein
MDRKNVQDHIVNVMENIRKKIREDLTNEDLAVWFGTKKKPKGSKQPKGPWVNICRKEDGKHPPCGREKATDKSYPKCRAAGVASKMTDDQKRAACAQKRRVEKTHSKVGKGNKPAMASYKPRKESMKKTLTITESKLISLIEKIIKEETGSASTGSYETPGFLAKNIPNMRQGAKTTYGGKGGKFVKIKSKCRKFPYCSQGAVDAPLELSDKYKGESSLSGEMELTPTYPKGYKGNVHLTKTKWVNEAYELSNDDKLKNNWAVFKVMHSKKYYATRLNEGNPNKIDVFSAVKYSNDSVLKFTYKESLKIVKENGGFGIKIGIVNNKGIQKVYDMSNKKGYVSSSDDVKHIEEESIPGGKSNGMTIREIAKKHKVSPQIAMKEWLKGIKVEMEHTDNKRIAREIAKDHLFEDIYYYKKLSKIEK